ncbi:MAG: rRNA maturation RNase YbeY [Clostridiales bacterium]|nr:rRNA maturation RNase YbeY [Clostridiales bacterium]
MIEILCEGVTLNPTAYPVIRNAAEQSLRCLGQAGDLTVLVAGETRITETNKTFRGQDSVTDVLSFPTREGEGAAADGYLGDILICLSRAKEQAKAYGHSLSRELAFLTVHGVLHLLGWDHMTEEDELAMRQKQREILEKL